MTTSKKKLLLPDAMARPGWELARSRADVDAVPFAPTAPNPEFRRLLHDADGVALTSTPLTAADVEAAPRLRAVGRIGVGYDAVDIAALNARGIPLMTCGTDNSPTVAEYALFMMLALAKGGSTMDALPRQGRWPERYNSLPTELLGKTLLVVGFGRIGTRADFVTVHCPKTKETTHMFDAARIAKMKPGARLINTARGGIVDEAALYAALAAGKLAGAGIDVFSPEPPLTDNPLFTLKNVIVAPHMAGNSRESLDRKSLTVVRNLLSVLDGAPRTEYVVNPEALQKR